MLEPIKRKFFSQNFELKNIEDLEPYIDLLLNYKIDSLKDLEDFLDKLSEIEAVVGEVFCWKQINITTHIENEVYKKEFEYFATQIQPKLQVFTNKINNKIIKSGYKKFLDKSFYISIKNIKTDLELFCENNIPIQSELLLLQQEYNNISSKMTVTIDEKELTLQQASIYLKNSDREKRKEAYLKIQERRLEDKDKLNELFSSLIQKRNQISSNKNCSNFTEYRFKELHRYEYKVKECLDFHEGVKKYFVPFVNDLLRAKKKRLNLEKLKPWDLDATELNKKQLTPFKTIDELLSKTKKCLGRIDPYFSNCIETMEKLKRLDLDSRKGKAPGGYNCPLPESGVPFMFMNAVGTIDDVVTIIHESGHAVHSFLSHSLPYTRFKDYPIEIAELASMSMELFSLNEWEIFFEDKDDLIFAKLKQWERVITIFPWIAIIDKFQHWIYSNPSHSVKERQDIWTEILNEFSSSEVDFSETQKYMPFSWQKQLHLYEVPFYYIEYGIAQLGAIAVYKNFKENKDACLKQYKKALSLGGTQTLKELYKTAGINLKFNKKHIKELSDFVKTELEELNV